MRLLLAIAVLGAASISAGQVTEKEGAYTFRAAWRPKMVVRYATSFGFSRDGKSGTVKGPMKIVVESVSAGTAGARVTVGPFASDGKVVSPPQTFRSKIGPQLGEKVLTDVQGPGTFNFGYSDRPVKIGGTWRQSVQSSARSGPVGGDYLYTLVGFRTVANRRVAVVHCHVEGSGANSVSQATIKGEAEILVDVADGIISSVRETLIVSKHQGPGDHKPNDKMTVEMTRVRS